MGPIERKLYLRAAAVLAIPPGGGIADGIAFFVDNANRARVMLEARQWTDNAIASVRAATDADPRWTNEDIAEQVLVKLDQRQKAILEGFKKPAD